MRGYPPGGDLNPNSKLNVRPGFSPGEPGGAPEGERRTPEAPKPSGGDGYTTSGIDRALSAHADRKHPVRRSVTLRRASPRAERFNDEQ